VSSNPWGTFFADYWKTLMTLFEVRSLVPNVLAYKASGGTSVDPMTLFDLSTLLDVGAWNPFSGLIDWSATVNWELLGFAAMAVVAVIILIIIAMNSRD